MAPSDHSPGTGSRGDRGVLVLDARYAVDIEVPSSWRPFVHRSGAGFSVSGDRTGYDHVHLYQDGAIAAVATDPGDLFAVLRGRGVQLEHSPFGISASLHNGLIPVPRTVYRNVSLLGMGDRAELTARAGRWETSFVSDYPWLPRLSNGRSVPSTRRLLDLLTASTIRQLGAVGGEGVLMLSSGKDSTALALAVAEAGLHDVSAVTYRTGPDDPEPPVAAETARRLGISHRIIDLPDSPDEVEKALTRFFERAPYPGTDLSQVPYCLALSAVEGARGAVIDGGGNDSYMGYPPKGKDLARLRYRIRGRRMATVFQRIADVDSPVNYLARSRAEAILPGRTPRMRHIERLYPDAVDMRSFWREVSARTRDLEPIDLYAVVGERHQNLHQDMMKHRLAATGVGMSSAYPWADDELADYYFELPEAQRYDVSSGTNKVLLRQMLSEFLDYDAERIGKHYFEFDSDRFLQRNGDFVRSEIDACDLWAPEGLRIVHGWLDRVDRRPLLYHAILTVFMVSGWWNHCAFLDPVSPEDGGSGE